MINVSELSPCDLFKPSIARLHEVSLLDLSALIPRPEGATFWGGSHPDSGHVELTELRITSRDPERPVALTAAAYRYWAR